MGRGESKLKRRERYARWKEQKEQRTAEAEQKMIDDAIDQFLNNNPKNKNIGEFIDYGDGLTIAGEYIEKSTVKDLVRNYIEPFNENVHDYGDGVHYWDEDQVVQILYKDGTYADIRETMYDIRSKDGTWSRGDYSKKIKTTGIDSIIIEGGWGTAVAGKSIEINDDYWDGMHHLEVDIKLKD